MTGEAEWADLRAGARSDALAVRAVAERLAARHRLAVEAALPGVEPGLRAFAEVLLTAFGGLAAEVELLRQRVEAGERTREDRMAIDPLGFIPSERFGETRSLPARAEIAADDPAAFGAGWLAPEAGARRSGGPWAALRLPALGGGRQRLGLELAAPAPGAVTALLDALPVALVWSEDGLAAEATLDLPEAEVLTGPVLLLSGGILLRRATLERVG
jgi:hypothetical protein